MAIIKRLFAVSMNRCAFPNCTNALIESEGGKVTGRICHIKGKKPGSARYDPIQSEEEREGFENLLLLCPIHHDVIDDDPDSYTVPRLHQIKQQHESQASERKEELNEEQVKQFIFNLDLSHGNFIYSPNQSGGQTGYYIINYDNSSKLSIEQNAQAGQVAIAIAGSMQGPIQIHKTEQRISPISQSDDFKSKCLTEFVSNLRNHDLKKILLQTSRPDKTEILKLYFEEIKCSARIGIFSNQRYFLKVYPDDIQIIGRITGRKALFNESEKDTTEILEELISDIRETLHEFVVDPIAEIKELQSLIREKKILKIMTEGMRLSKAFSSEFFIVDVKPPKRFEIRIQSNREERITIRSEENEFFFTVVATPPGMQRFGNEWVFDRKGNVVDEKGVDQFWTLVDTFFNEAISEMSANL